jgi:serine/threonine-protein kinase
VTVRLGFTQNADDRSTDSTQVLRLSGDTEYTRRVTGEFAAPPECGERALRLVTIATVPAGDVRSRTMRLDLPACEPDPGSSQPEGPNEEERVPNEPAPDGTL